jgi:coenzyme F420-reducing hydrogenase delta subunit
MRAPAAQTAPLERTEAAPQERPTRLLAICCNWSPFACLNAAGQAHLEMPPEYAFMRVMCIGRINQALILRAFEYGADGVILLECKDEDCRYGPGPEVGHSNVDKVRRLLHLLGIGQSRLVERSFQAHEKEELVKSLWEFSAQIKALGPNPAKPPQQDAREHEVPQHETREHALAARPQPHREPA